MDRKNIWKSYSVFQSAANSQIFLQRYYEWENRKDTVSLSYDNCYTFIYYLQHGRTYYEQAKIAPLSIQPVLLFYGMVHLIKACVLLSDPFYPASSSVLAHGVSTRKRKKKNYVFLEDEVKIQKEGLFTHFSDKMFHMKHLEGEKYTMGQLLRRLPELSDLFLFQKNKPHQYLIGSAFDTEYYIPAAILDDLKMTAGRFSSFLQKQMTKKTDVQYSPENDSIRINCQTPVKRYASHPFMYNFDMHTMHIGTEKPLYEPFPELLIHYLILYNLSMICRYETEWWNELLHNFETSDFPFIQQFLSLTANKVPFLIFEFLLDQKNFSLAGQEERH
ncbi:YaaC family protein [Bacillus marinisedimentorum]|uniref:YaaC family protein n=1 Tax=Bacillus marinisedimentorum TaxID=1821260 RepID=UPI001FE21FBF|nr:YaaC family protein [Bacillus marinisedimentorum]